MKLHRKRPKPGVVDTLAGSVVGVGEADPPHPDGVRVHGVAVVLAGDIGPGTTPIPHGLVHAPVAIFQLEGLPSRRQRRQLVPQADAEQGDVPQQLPNGTDY